MFTHVRLGSNDVAKSKSFYDAALAPLGLRGQDLGGTIMYANEAGRLMVAAPREGAATPANGFTLGFQAPSSEAVDQFHAAGLANGGSCEGAPGDRAGYGIYAAYLRDPDGNKICAITPSK